MSLTFFTTEQGFQKNLADPSAHHNKPRDYTTSAKRDAFESKKSNDVPQKRDDAQNTDKADKKDSFSEFMRALREKQAQQENVQKSAEKFLSTQDGAAKTSDRPVKAQALMNALSDTQSISKEETGADLLNITKLHSEIQKLIDAQAAQAAQSESGGEIIVSDDMSAKEIESIFALLASMVTMDSAEGEESAKTDKGGLNALLEKIQKMSESDEGFNIVSGLTTQDLTALQDQIRKYLNDELAEKDQDALEALAAQYVAMMPAKSDRSAAADTQKQQNAPAVALKETDLKAAKNPVSEDIHHAERRYDARYTGEQGRYSTGADNASARGDAPDFKGMMKDAGAPSMTAQQAAAQSAKNNQAAATSGQLFLQNSTGATAALPDMMLAADGTLQTTNAMASAAQSAQTTAQANITNVVTQSQSAGQGHPATQMVSATIQKAVKAGDNTNIKLNLDPPELGRVEVKMSIDGDNTTKIVLTAEKPETYMMLQKDSDALQRAMAEAGLDMDNDGSLSFELASEDHDFNQNTKHGQGDGQGRSGKNGDAADDTIIESTMDWHVDPDTGHMRYNIMA